MVNLPRRPAHESAPGPSPASPHGLSPDAILFESLLSSRPGLPREETHELADLVLRLAGAVRETSVALREASACLAEKEGQMRLPELLSRAETACMQQANCTTALIQRLAPRLAAA